MKTGIMAALTAGLLTLVSACSGGVTLGVVSETDPDWSPHRGPPGGQDITPEQARWLNRVQATPAGR